MPRTTIQEFSTTKTFFLVVFENNDKKIRVLVAKGENVTNNPSVMMHQPQMHMNKRDPTMVEGNSNQCYSLKKNVSTRDEITQHKNATQHINSNVL